MAALTTHGGGKYEIVPLSYGVRTWQLTTGVSSLALVPQASRLDQLALDAAGFTAWRTTTRPARELYGLTGISCPTTTFYSCASNDLCIAGFGSGLLVSTDAAGPASGWAKVALPLNAGVIEGACAPGSGLCVAVDQAGNITASSDPTSGAGAWSVAPVDTLPCVVSGGCTTEAIRVNDHSGVRTLDSVGPGNGSQLQNLTFTGNALSWTHDGAPRSATLR
ncbi:MAG: hypothetical protein M3022_01160 [Actinomycetota bacterium]|nr:hypothetical protein [Actinomycetota bacterium]